MRAVKAARHPIPIPQTTGQRESSGQLSAGNGTAGGASASAAGRRRSKRVSGHALRRLPCPTGREGLAPIRGLCRKCWLTPRLERPLLVGTDETQET
jgi:hypothetical protein